MDPALFIKGVSKRYTGHLAVDDLSLAVPSGTIYGILGPNGAGKSTLIRMVMDIIARDSGEIEILGQDPSADKGVLRRVGYLPEERGLYRKMKVLDVIIFFAQLKGLSRDEARRGGEEWLERMGLGEWGAAKVETLSKGMQQKVQFITTVLHDPDLLILDEPTSGLDPVNQEVLRDTILGARTRGKTVIFCTHNMGQAEQLCDHVCIISGGRKVLDGELRQIRRDHRGESYRLEFDERTAEVDEFMTNNRRFSSVRQTTDGWEVDLMAGADPREL
ncbi:MAG TPA: ATP-binding cassette domain-containing protein, partial [Longimicrobiaceae bacterium]|nr:ATP-binding cassette domain-containing protein [Longimicrobiaceae bacterium]